MIYEIIVARWHILMSRLQTQYHHCFFVLSVSSLRLNRLMPSHILVWPLVKISKPVIGQFSRILLAYWTIVTKFDLWLHQWFLDRLRSISGLHLVTWEINPGQWIMLIVWTNDMGKERLTSENILCLSTGSEQCRRKTLIANK